MNLHITHHGGTNLCAFARKHSHLATGSFACFFTPAIWEDKHASASVGPFAPSRQNEYFDAARSEGIGFVNWEYRGPPHIPIKSVEWEKSSLISILVVRDPIARLLSSAGLDKIRYGSDLPTRTDAQWRNYEHAAETDNYQLRIVAGCSRNVCDVDADTLETAKVVARQITYVIDLACLDENMLELAKRLGWSTNLEKKRKGGHHIYKSNAERVGNAARLRRLQKRNEFDIQFYKWAKTQSLVRCDDLPRVPARSADAPRKSVHEETKGDLVASNNLLRGLHLE